MERGRSRYYKHTIMANCGFGDLTILREGHKMIIPQKFISKEGKVNRTVQKLINLNDYDGLISKEIIVSKI